MSIGAKRCQMAGFCWLKGTTQRLEWPCGRKQCASYKRETNNFAIQTRSISSTSLVYFPERIDCISSSSTVFAVAVMRSPTACPDGRSGSLRVKPNVTSSKSILSIHSTLSLSLSPAVVVISSAGVGPSVVGSSAWRLLGARLRNYHRLVKWPLKGFLWLLC